MIFIKTGDFVNKVKPYLQKAAFLQILNFKPVKVSKMDYRGQSDQKQTYIDFLPAYLQRLFFSDSIQFIAFIFTL